MMTSQIESHRNYMSTHNIQTIENWVLNGESRELNVDINPIYDDVVKWIVTKMPKTSSENHSISFTGRFSGSKTRKNALLPKLGLSFTADEDEDAKSMRYMNHRMVELVIMLFDYTNTDFGRQLWWMTPTILNFLDHTKVSVKLLGVDLLVKFLQLIPNQIFNNSGLFSVYYDSLKGLCYYFPPYVTHEITLQIFKKVYPCLVTLISKKSKNEDIFLEFFGDVLLRTTIPRICDLNPALSVYVLNFLNVEYLTKRRQLVTNPNRITYLIGENYVRNPYLTVSTELLDETQKFVSALIDINMKGKYDYLAMIIIMWEKCMKEGLDDHHSIFQEMYLKINDKSPLQQNEKTQLILSRKDIDLNKLII